MHNPIEISILIFSQDGTEISIDDINNGNDYLDEDLTPYKLWGIDGGLEVIVNGYKRILRCFEFYVSLNSIDFLINSILWINGQLEKADIDDNFPECITSNLTTGNILKICDNENGTLQFSYEPTKTSSLDSKRFFKKEIISKEEWKIAATNVLNNYFQLVKSSILNHPDNEKTKIMSSYIQHWDKIKK